MTLNAALAVGNIVKTKIEEEMHKHQHPDEGDEEDTDAEATAEAVGGEDVAEEDAAEPAKEEQSAATPGGDVSKGEGYFSDDSTAPETKEV